MKRSNLHPALTGEMYKQRHDNGIDPSFSLIWTLVQPSTQITLMAHEKILTDNPS